MLRARTFALTVLVFVLAAAPARAFEVLRHSNMTGEVLARQGVSPAALKFILQGVRWPDITQCVSGCYCPSYLQWFCSDPDSAQVIQFSASHYDNNQITESMDNVQTLMTLARSGLDRPLPTNDAERRQVGVALMFFGEALHAIQDFYAHSTWIELNRDLIRVGGHLYSCPLWNGETTGGSGSTTVGGVSVSGVQTGYVDIAPPAGSVTHDALNKDSPGSTQGSIVVNRIFPATRIGTYYELASGQINGSYTDDGAAPRHTIKGLQCLISGSPVYNLPAPASPGHAGVPVVTPASAAGISETMAWIETDSTMLAIGARIDSLWASSSPDTPSTFPLAQFDDDGWPLPATASVTDPFVPVARLLAGPAPNPANGRTAIRFQAPRAGPVRLEVFDLTGRRVRLLLDRDVEPGWKEVWWAGLDDAGRALPSGTYLARLSGFGRSESCRVAILH
ncbi:MAG: T9SS type A sorting domain-containing protein [Candidatus Eisenbacteria bacterium]|nr:T9SS type A sorting domain-containing protein [Candidatus Eisenbacteria bacterium]